MTLGGLLHMTSAGMGHLPKALRRRPSDTGFFTVKPLLTRTAPQNCASNLNHKQEVPGTWQLLMNGIIRYLQLRQPIQGHLGGLYEGL